MRAVVLLLALGWGVADAAAAEPPSLTLCTGTRGNNYHQAGVTLAKRLEGRVQVEVVETQGSWENLEAIDVTPRRCDAIIAQDDAWTLYQFEKPDSTLTMDRLATLYPEYVHLLCNREQVPGDQVFGLDPAKHRVLINEYGSGTYITWKLFGRLNPIHARLPASEVGLEEGLARVAAGTEAQCMVFVSGIGAGSLRAAEERFGDRLKLVSIMDKRLLKRVGRERREVYREARVPAGSYPRLMAGTVETLTVDAVFFASPEWKARHPEAARHLAAALTDLRPGTP